VPTLADLKQNTYVPKNPKEHSSPQPLYRDVSLYHVPQDEPAEKTTGLAEQGALAGTQEKKDGLPLMEAREGNSRGVQGSR